MISRDMKYTALYWALGFDERKSDVYEKNYNGYKISVFAEEQKADYGNRIKTEFNALTRHKDFVVLECVDRLLKKGYKPESISLYGESEVIVKLDGGDILSVQCEQWGEDYARAKKKFTKGRARYSVLYTSRLVSGLLEFKSTVITAEGEFSRGVFEEDARTLNYVLTGEIKADIERVKDICDFEISSDELIFYRGKSKTVKVPEGIKTIGAGAFWNNVFVEEVILPASLERLGGDCFYYCKNLKKVNIPSGVRIMGNNPFAGCPQLEISNESKRFLLRGGVLYNAEKTNLIHYSIKNPQKEFTVPDGVICLGKHCFYACDRLEKIVIPKSVKKFENNPFSGCTRLSVENNSPYYSIENGVIYNAYKTAISGCLNGAEIECFKVPESVTLLGRNCFWNCKGVKKIVLTKNIQRIGYNPFAGCENLIIESENENFKVVGGIVYDKTLTHVLCATDRAAGKVFKAADGVTHVARGAFSGCKSLEVLDLNGVKHIDKSAFTGCAGLTEIYVPDGVEYIGEWAFAYCDNLKKISVGKNTFIDKNAFNECPVKILRRKQ